MLLLLLLGGGGAMAATRAANGTRRRRFINDVPVLYVMAIERSKDVPHTYQGTRYTLWRHHCHDEIMRDLEDLLFSVVLLRSLEFFEDND